jgi:60 kDa SS-A/Ro ribonucleoprotein
LFLRDLSSYMAKHMKLNRLIPSPRTAQGAVAARINDEQQLRRSVMACLLWEDAFYEEGVSIAERLCSLVPKVEAGAVQRLAVEARDQMKLRHVPLLLVREMARLPSHRQVVAETLEAVIQRPDELAEFLAIYWKEKKQPLSAQVKKGLAAAFPKFDAYQLAKYNRDHAIKLRDVLFLSHARPKDAGQEAVWKQLVDKTLEPPDTWEVALSAGNDRKATWERLLAEGKLGALALLRNLRNMTGDKVAPARIKSALREVKVERVLPFRFIAAARHAPDFEPEIEQAMLKCLGQQARLPGKTILMVDVSGSMGGRLSRKSEMTRMEVAFGLAILARELCEEVKIYATAGNDHTMVHATCLVPARRGFALSDSVRQQADRLGGGGIFLTQCLEFALEREQEGDRVIVLTDEQDCDRKLSPDKAPAFGRQNYIVNISCERNGIAYGKFTHIDGWSEAVLDYIRCAETLQS